MNQDETDDAAGHPSGSAAQDEAEAAEKLSKKLDTVMTEGERIAALGRQYTTLGQNLHDLAGSSKAAFRYIRSPSELKRLHSEFDYAIPHLELIGPAASGSAPSLAALASGVASAISISISMANVDPSIVARADVQAVFGAIDAVIQRPDVLASATQEMTRLGLDQTGGKWKSPVEQLETAHAAYAGPVTDSVPTNTSTIPLREAVSTTISMLLQRRPKQEPASNHADKIRSIGAQLRKTSVPLPQIEAWATDWTRIQTSLSSTKQNSLTRADWTHLLYQTTHFLAAFLGALDEAALRP